MESIADEPGEAAEQALGGLTLEQYAGVTAALAEEFPLTEILAQEGIEPTMWPPASRAWIEAPPPTKPAESPRRGIARRSSGTEMGNLSTAGKNAPAAPGR